MIKIFPDVQGLTVSTLKYRPNSPKWQSQSMRSHETHRLVLITKGQGRITVAGLTNGFGPNNLIYIPADTIYGMEIGAKLSGFVLTMEAVPASWPQEPQHLRLTDVTRQKELVSFFDLISQELDETGDARAASCQFALLCIFIERQIAAQSAEEDQRRRTAAAKLVAKYTTLIGKHFRSDMGVADYADKLGVTPTHLTRCCRKTCGRSALDLLNDRKHFEACVLLRDTRTPIGKIAANLGFHSSAYFTRSFQEKSGQTPSEFRRLT